MQILEKPARLSLTEILVITELPPWADPAVPYALSLARQHDAKIWIAHAVSPHLHNKVTALPHVGAFCQTWRYELSMAKARHILLDASDVALRLQFMMHERKFDLVIVSSRNIGRGGLSLGKAAMRVLDSADCPILIFGPNLRDGRMAESKPATILYPTDFSPQALAAAQHAFSWALEYGARLSMLHVTEGIDAGTHNESIRMEEPYLRWLAELIPEELTVWCEVDRRVSFGSAGRAIVEAAREQQADMIVIGLSGLDGARTASPGKTLSHVIREAPCPVFVVGRLTNKAAKFNHVRDHEPSDTAMIAA